MFCNKCGKQIDDNSRFCEFCGVGFAGVDNSPMQQYQAQQQQPPPYFQQPAAYQNTSGFGWYIKAMKQYVDFSGRARRKEYWMFYLFNMVFFVLTMILDNLLGTTFEILGESLGYGWFYMIYAFAVFLPSLAVGVRRLHDIGKSGWFYLIGLIPFVGAIILLVWFCTNSQFGANKWGANPKEFTPYQ